MRLQNNGIDFKKQKNPTTIVTVYWELIMWRMLNHGLNISGSTFFIITLVNFSAILWGKNYHFYFIGEDTESRGIDYTYVRPSSKWSKNLKKDLPNSEFVFHHECQTTYAG